MKKLLLYINLLIVTIPAIAQYSISGGTGSPYEYTEDLTGTGLQKVHILNTLSNAQLTYTSRAISVKFYHYQLSSADKQQVTASEYSNGGEITYTVSGLLDSHGYLIEENGTIKHAFWIIDYNIHQPILTSIEAIESDDKCDYLKLLMPKSDELSFYGTSGIKKDIQRKYTLSYDNLVWNDDEDKKRFEQKAIIKESLFGTETVIEAPLNDTHFRLEGDQFAKHFNLTKTIESALYKAVAVEAHIVEERINGGKAENEKPPGEGTNSFNVPITMNFYGYGNEPTTAYYKWLIYNKQDLNNPIAQRTDRDFLDYKFEDFGDFIVKLEVTDRTSSCTKETTYELNLSDSYLDIPNYFSPGASPGSNDEFRVAYRSLVRFKCTIFNRWGVKLYEWTDPAKGWDGKYKGKYVNTGVYYYVIIAEGSDGKKYKKGGDINIFKGR
ncbi:MAG: gliding motility-associated C-terminal domain-containing protein [Dysgonomonas sp.]|nr:gliding motility-associated C-terminal domain-containing protein [Dysgonomonas sp.]